MADVDTHKGLRIVPFATKKEWIAWLRDHHTEHDGVWVKLAKKAKKASGHRSISYVQAREGALMYGWIDGLKSRYDDEWYAIRITPRRKRSKWSLINRRIAEELIAAKKMRKAGRAEVEAARADGRWDQAYASQSEIVPHPEMQAALDASPKAAARLASVSRALRFSVLYNVQEAKRDATRTRRVAKFIGMLERGEI